MTSVVILDKTSGGLGTLLTGLLQAAAEDPAKAQALNRMRGRVRITVTDADADMAVAFSPREVVVSDGPSDADVHISLPTDSLMTLPALPRWGVVPRFTTPAGRGFYRQLRTRDVRVRGLRHLRLLRGLMDVLAV